MYFTVLKVFAITMLSLAQRPPLSFAQWLPPPPIKTNEYTKKSISKILTSLIFGSLLQRLFISRDKKSIKISLNTVPAAA
jgi:hypothetical protein